MRQKHGWNKQTKKTIGKHKNLTLARVIVFFIFFVNRNGKDVFVYVAERTVRYTQGQIKAVCSFKKELPRCCY